MVDMTVKKRKKKVEYINLHQNFSKEKTNKWRPPSLSKLTLIMFCIELTHLGSEISKYIHEMMHIKKFKRD